MIDKYPYMNEQPKDASLEIFAPPSWIEEMENVFQILKNTFQALGQPLLSYVDKRDEIRAKIECSLNENDTLVVSCLGKNELSGNLVFKIFIAQRGENFQLHLFEQNIPVPTSDGKNPQEGALLTRLGSVLEKILRRFYQSADVADFKE